MNNKINADLTSAIHSVDFTNKKSYISKNFSSFLEKNLIKALSESLKIKLKMKIINKKTFKMILIKVESHMMFHQHLITKISISQKVHLLYKNKNINSKKRV